MDKAGDLVHVDSQVHWTDVAAIGSEAAENCGPAVLFENTPGHARLASGIYGGPDQMQRRDRKPWTRFCRFAGMENADYMDCVAHLNTIGNKRSDIEESELSADTIDSELYSLGLPSFDQTNQPAITLALLAYQTEEGTTWAPVRGKINGGEK